MGMVMKRSGLRKWKTWEQQVRKAVYLAAGVGLLTGTGLTVGIIAITQSWFGWGW
jgi:hypothetical protein